MTNIDIKIENQQTGAKNLQFLSTFASRNSDSDPNDEQYRISLRQESDRTRGALRRTGAAPFRGGADRTLALQAACRGAAAHERPSGRGARTAGRTVRPGARRSRTDERLGRRNEKIPLPHAAGRLHRVGLHPRRRARHALRRRRAASWAAPSAPRGARG